ncbi:MAG TPA: septum formation protein Maf [Chloroflexi bacterium]|nr:septum formation protein Maf [Chloroflexota bacterium]
MIETGKARPKVILASGSPRRRELLRLLGLPFQVVRPDMREEGDQGSPPALQARALAQRKALSVSNDNPTNLVLGADTLVVLDGEVMGKPSDVSAAWAMLRALRGQEHLVITGLCLVQPGRDRPEVDAVQTRVWMRDYADQEIAGYIARGEPFDKAGAYAIQDAYFSPVQEIEGCYANVMGLPLCHLFAALERLGLCPPSTPQAACEAHLQRTCDVAKGILRSLDH